MRATTKEERIHSSSDCPTSRERSLFHLLKFELPYYCPALAPSRLGRSIEPILPGQQPRVLRKKVLSRHKRQQEFGPVHETRMICPRARKILSNEDEELRDSQELETLHKEILGRALKLEAGRDFPETIHGRSTEKNCDKDDQSEFSSLCY